MEISFTFNFQFTSLQIISNSVSDPGTKKSRDGIARCSSETNTVSMLEVSKKNQHSTNPDVQSTKATMEKQRSPSGQRFLNDCKNSTTSSEALRSKLKREQEISLAVTLVIIALVFICCQSVKLITDVYELFYCDRISSNDTSIGEPGEHLILYIRLILALTYFLNLSNFLLV